jgi:TPR repeat protein
MAHVRALMLVALGVLLIGGRGVKIQGPQPLTPQAAQQYASDSEKAERGDPDAAYRMGEAFESGRLAGVKDLDKALTYYRIAAEKGHKEAAARALQLEVELEQSRKKGEKGAGSPPAQR